MTSRLRLISGLVLLAFVLGHLLNHIAGLISVEAMNALLFLSIAPWRTAPGTALLVGAVVVHVALSLWSIFSRRTLRLRPAEAAQLGLGLLIPVLLAEHVIGTRGAHEALGVRTEYALVLYVHWVDDPLRAALQAVALLVAWGHAMLGLHFWLRVRPWYPAVRPAGFAAALLVPALALAGWIAAGLDLRAAAQDPAFVAALLEGARVTPETPGFVERGRTAVQLGFLAVLLAILAGRGARVALRARRRPPRLIYRDLRTVDILPGGTALESLRAAGVPHASVCGGRGRCSTCRVRVGAGGEHLPPPEERERRVLERVGAPPDVRLACQIRPTHDLEVTPLLPPTAAPRDGWRRPAYLQGQEREIAVLFADLRGFTRLSDNRLPYDVVFVLNRYFAAMGRAVETSGGRLDKFIGDGVMALFGIETGAAEGCRRALACARAMADALDTLNESLGGEIPEPLRIAVGVHAGPAIVGEMGYGDAKSLTAIGDAVNVASRLEAVAKELDVTLVVSDTAARLAGLDLSDWPAHARPLRGKAAPTIVRAVAEPRGLPVAPAGPDRAA